MDWSSDVCSSDLKEYSGPVQFGPNTRSLVPDTWHPERPANHTNRDCWVFKQAGKLIAENKNKGPHSDDEEEPPPSPKLSREG